MTPARYHHEAAQTRMDHPTAREALIYAGLKLAGEAGEVRQTADSYSKATTADRIKELGDVCWYVSLIADRIRMDPESLWMPPPQAVVVTWFDATNRLIVAACATSEAIGKAFWHGGQMAPVERKLRNVAAAVHWCAAILGLDVADVWAVNIAKLRERHPDGFKPGYSSENP